MSPREVRAFIRDFAILRLDYILDALDDEESISPSSLLSSSGVEWQDEDALVRSGIDPEWLVGFDRDPGAVFLHEAVALRHDWKSVGNYLAASMLSAKQRRALFPNLGRARRPDTAKLDVTEVLLEELRDLNSLLYHLAPRAQSLVHFWEYQRHLAIHGASQNVGGQTGAVGAAMAVVDGLEELQPGCIADRYGMLPTNARTPLEIFRYQRTKGDERPLKALLLRNNRAVLFPSDPDIAIIQPLSGSYSSAEEAYERYERVRKSPAERAREFHEFALGEVKTATDVQNLHERLALGSRETEREVRAPRFLMMAVMTKDLVTAVDPVSGGGGQRSARRPLRSRDVNRFSEVFNLYFLWGYDGARQLHPHHWGNFKAALANWCGY